MKSPLDVLLAILRDDLHVSPTILERVERLNPNHREGGRARGIYRKPTAARIARYGYMSKGQFLRQHDPILWKLIPSGCIVKQGRRKFLRLQDCEDQVWLFPPAHPARKQRPKRIHGEGWV